ncbi:MAG TPA: hypothetical protein VGN17_19720 [Bryobacteraceae bacterium]|jgi:hypothetical protein
MRTTTSFLLSAACFGLTAFGQTQPASVAPQWDMAATITAFSAQAGRVKPILDQLTPQAWVAQGAPDVYVSQWTRARQDLASVLESVTALDRNPEKLTAALDAYFRWTAFEARIGSLVEGVRHYQNPAIGDLLVGAVAENSPNRDRLQQHISDLAAQQEQELVVVGQEAQRCRTNLNPRTPARPAPVKPTSGAK